MNSLAKLNFISSETYTAQVPGSKSLTNRALILAAQKMGKTIINNALICDDTKYLAAALNSFNGISVEQIENRFVVHREQLEVTSPKDAVFMGGAGTPARFMLAFAASVTGETLVIGNDRLSERPMKDILDTFKAAGIQYECMGTEGCLPVKVLGGKAQKDHWSVSGEVSSQFLSSLLLHAAQQSQFKEVTVSVPGHLVSRPYVNMTLAMMKNSGIAVSEIEKNVFKIIPGAPVEDVINVEVDASGLSYPISAAVLTQSRVHIPGISLNSAQGDVGLFKVYQQMGCEVKEENGGVTIIGKPIQGISVDMETMPDVVLSLGVVASQAGSETHITNIANLRVKECDRIAACANELKRLGVEVEEGEDWLKIKPSKNIKPALVHTYDDHRVAMAFSLLGLIYDGVEVEDPDCVSKSFPNFWNEMKRFIDFHVSAEVTC